MNLKLYKLDLYKYYENIDQLLKELRPTELIMLELLVILELALLSFKKEKDEKKETALNSLLEILKKEVNSFNLIS